MACPPEDMKPAKCLDEPTRPTKCPTGCKSFYDGCNMCRCGDKGEMACTRMGCKVYEEAKCMDEEPKDECDGKKMCCPKGSTCMMPRGGTAKKCVGQTDALLKPVPCGDGPKMCPKDCKRSYFDGCNRCRCMPTGMACTKMACAEKGEPKCMDDEVECPKERQCLSGDIKPMPGSQSEALKCCAEDEECLPSRNPQEGSSCVKKLQPRKLGESCGGCLCPPRYTMGECVEGLTCYFEPGLADAPGRCMKPETVECEGDLEYHTCGTACPNKCGEKVPDVCTEECVKGCACKFDLFQKGSKCVPEKECGPKIDYDTPCKKLKDLASAKVRDDCNCKIKKGKVKKCKTKKVKKVKCKKIRDLEKCLENKKCELSRGKKKRCQDKPKRL